MDFNAVQATFTCIACCHSKLGSDAGRLIVSGSIAISEWARTWAFEPGLYTAAQIEGWQRVTREVHDHGGVIFGQLGMVAARAMSRISRTVRLQLAPPRLLRRKRSPWPSIRMVGQHSWCKANLVR